MSAVKVPFEIMEHARCLVRRGRYWLDLGDEAIDRGALGVLRSSEYRSELVATALRHAAIEGDAVDDAIVVEADSRIDEWLQTGLNGSSLTSDEVGG